MDKLKPCPFCGGGETRFDKNENWTGQRMLTHSVTLRHFCNQERSGIQFTRKTEELCTEAWNKRPESVEVKNG